MANTIEQLFLTMTSRLPTVNLKDFHYDLPENRIARYPLADRDQSKLLVWRNGKIAHLIFNQLTDALPIDSTLFFNNTRVIPARLIFNKNTGAIIEIFLLNPAGTNSLMAEALSATNRVIWECTVGNLKRWDSGTVLRKHVGQLELTAAWHDRKKGLVEFSWTPGDSFFTDVVNAAGAVPLPPYIKREAELADRDRYQTIYSRFEGAVAAPTAGLHFTPLIMDQLQARGIQCDFLTLHVSAGTFLPIKEENAARHRMHKEQVIIRKDNIINLLRPNKRIIAIGTTALRTLESMYWYGALLKADKNAPFFIAQNLPYEFMGKPPTTTQALETVLEIMHKKGVEELTGHTALYVMPGYRFRIAQGLLTNFHQPDSTLLLLIAAFIGSSWKNVYEEAMANNYRFLSYGDSSLLLPDNGLIF